MNLDHDPTLSYQQFADLDTGVSEFGHPAPIFNVTVIPAPGLVERAVAIDMNEHLTWRETWIAVWGITVVTLFIITAIFWEATR